MNKNINYSIKFAREDYGTFLPVTTILLLMVAPLRRVLGVGSRPELVQELSPWTSNSVVSPAELRGDPPVTK